MIQPFRSLSAYAGVIILACVLFFLAFPLTIAPRFAALFADFGSSANLPFFTRLALKPIYAIAVQLFLLGGMAAGIARPRERAILLSLTAGGGIALAIASMISLYLPIFSLAGQIQAE